MKILCLRAKGKRENVYAQFIPMFKTINLCIMLVLDWREREKVYRKL